MRVRAGILLLGLIPSSIRAYIVDTIECLDKTIETLANEIQRQASNGLSWCLVHNHMRSVPAHQDVDQTGLLHSARLNHNQFFPAAAFY